MKELKERNYQFRERMLRVHKPGRRMDFVKCQKGQIEVAGDWTIWIPQAEDRILYNAARDLEDYFSVSMGLSLRVQMGDEIPSKAIVYDPLAELEQNRYGLRVEEPQITLKGATPREAARAGYFLEDLMNRAEGPYLDLQDTNNIQKGENTQEILTDAVIDTLLGIGSALISSMVSGAMTGAISGSVAPGVGNLIGMVTGAAVGVGIYLLTEVVTFKGKPIKEWWDISW